MKPEVFEQAAYILDKHDYCCHAINAVIKLPCNDYFNEYRKYFCELFKLRRGSKKYLYFGDVTLELQETRKLALLFCAEVLKSERKRK